MEQAFLDYSMSVIVGRALPDVRDGLKPVQRRILYSMWESGLHPDRPHRKCASAVGEVMKTYHPHGDSSIYDALVRMAQDFTTREPLIDGHGNFGSVDGDPPAAMRYTEARLSPIAMELLAGIAEETVDEADNYDGYDTEPVVLPARFPNLLVNGASGIAVGMATNVPPHNLGEVIDACLHLLRHPDAGVADLQRHIPAPDLPTGARIIDGDGITQAYASGRGAITVEGVASTETRTGNLPRIVVTEIPYQVTSRRSWNASPIWSPGASSNPSVTCATSPHGTGCGSWSSSSEGRIRPRSSSSSTARPSYAPTSTSTWSPSSTAAPARSGCATRSSTTSPTSERC